MNKKVVVGDADSLVALVYQDDANHVKAESLSKWLQHQGYEVIYPNTAILEAITALKRSLNLIEEAHFLNNQYRKGAFLVEFITAEIQERASQRFDKTISKKDTIFDAIVVEVAVKLETELIFSFDDWYSKQGFNLVKKGN